MDGFNDDFVPPSNKVGERRAPLSDFVGESRFSKNPIVDGSTIGLASPRPFLREATTSSKRSDDFVKEKRTPRLSRELN